MLARRGHPGETPRVGLLLSEEAQRSGPGGASVDTLAMSLLNVDCIRHTFGTIEGVSDTFGDYVLRRRNV